jgi:uncharacterized protein YjiS (DUF1127 family)
MAHALFHSASAAEIQMPRPVAYLRGLLSTWRHRMEDRAELARFTERDLRDAGFDRGQVEFEINKPFWRA